jgi:hypothetical protein
MTDPQSERLSTSLALSLTSHRPYEHIGVKQGP